jgi:hypothetical protein
VVHFVLGLPTSGGLDRMGARRLARKLELVTAAVGGGAARDLVRARKDALHRTVQDAGLPRLPVMGTVAPSKH